MNGARPAWAKATAFLEEAGFRPTCLSDLFRVPRHVLEQTLAVCAAELSEDGSREAYGDVLSQWNQLDSEAQPLLQSRKAYSAFLPSCVGLALSRHLLLSGTARDAYSAAYGALEGHRTSLRSAVQELNEQTPVPMTPSVEHEAHTPSDDWYWFLPADHPYSAAHQRELRDLRSPVVFLRPTDAADALIRAGQELKSIAMLIEEAGDPEPWRLATAYSPGGPLDFRALADWSRFWKLGAISAAFEQVASFALLDTPPPSLGLGLEMARRLLGDGLVDLAKGLVDRLQKLHFEFDDEEQRHNQKLQLATVRAQVAKRQGDPAAAFAELTAFFDRLPPEITVQLALSSSQEYVEAQQLLAYIEGWRDAQKGQLGAEELREHLAQMKVLMFSSRSRDLQLAESVSQIQSTLGLIREDQQAQSTLMLELPAHVRESLREDLRLEAELIGRLSSETLAIREWSRVTDELIRKTRPDAAQERLTRRFGESWLQLTSQARDSLTAVEIIELQYDEALAHLALVGLVGAFEAELRSTLANRRITVPSPGMLRDLVVVAASQPAGRLQEVGTMCLGTQVLESRNDAAHGRKVSDAEYQRARELILAVGSGLIWKLTDV